MYNVNNTKSIGTNIRQQINIYIKKKNYYYITIIIIFNLLLTKKKTK